MQGVALRPPRDPLTDGVVAVRVWRRTDAAQVHDIIARNPDIPRWTLMPEPFTREDAEQFIRSVPEQWRSGDTGLFCITPADDLDRVIGSVGIYTRMHQIGHLGYWVAAAERGRGVATRALRLVCRWAFATTDLVRLELQVIPGNEASIRVAERVGFQREGVLRSSINQRGEHHDGIMYSLLPGELVRE